MPLTFQLTIFIAREDMPVAAGRKPPLDGGARRDDAPARRCPRPLRAPPARRSLRRGARPDRYGEFRVLVFARRSADLVRAGGARRDRARRGGGRRRSRAHSECWTGEALHSLKCDCREAVRPRAARRRRGGRGRGALPPPGGPRHRARQQDPRMRSSPGATRSTPTALGFPDDLRSYRPQPTCCARSASARWRCSPTTGEGRGLEAEGCASSGACPWPCPSAAQPRVPAREQNRMGHDLPDGMLGGVGDERGRRRRGGAGAEEARSGRGGGGVEARAGASRRCHLRGRCFLV